MTKHIIIYAAMVIYLVIVYLLASYAPGMLLFFSVLSFLVLVGAAIALGFSLPTAWRIQLVILVVECAAILFVPLFLALTGRLGG